MPVIDAVELYHVAMPLIYPWRTAYGSDDVIESVLVKMHAGDAAGWGETTPLAKPTYSPEYTAGVFSVTRDVLAPLLVGKRIDSGQDLHEACNWVAGNFFAKGGLDAAWWDLDMIAAVRSAFPNPVFHIDCNSGYTLEDLPMFRKLDRYNLAMIEQPLMRDDLVDHAELQRQIETPVCLDESITSPAKARKAIRIGAARWINIKPARVGGLTQALEANRICEEEGVPCWTGGMLESALGASFCMALSTLPNMKYPSDVFPSTRFYERDLSAPPLELSGPSQMVLNETPGAGAEPVPELLEQQTIDRAVIDRSTARP